MPVIIPIAMAGLAAYQAINGAVKAKKAQNAMRDMAAPTYAPNKAIKDYYETSLQQANANPYDSQYYKQAKEDAGVNLAAGLGALRDRGASIGSVSRLVGITNRNIAGAGVNAEQMRDRRIAQLGQAAGMQAGEDRQAFQYNQYMPYENRFNMEAAKASAGSQQVNAGMQNMGSALNSFAAMRSGGSGGAGGYSDSGSGSFYSPSLDRSYSNIGMDRGSAIGGYSGPSISINPYYNNNPYLGIRR